MMYLSVTINFWHRICRSTKFSKEPMVANTTPIYILVWAVSYFTTKVE